MRLSEALEKIEYPCTLISDGTFSVLEQCTRIRAPQALVYLENAKYLSSLTATDISCVICTPEIKDSIPVHIQGIVCTDAPKLVFFKIQDYLTKQRHRHPTVIDKTARISPQAYVSPYNVVIGKNVEIQAFVAIGENTVIEDNVRICYGTIVGAQSFSTVREKDKLFLVNDAGSTRIEEGVEICGQCDIACGTLQMDTTVIGAYSKLDAKVHIGHGTVLGKRVQIPSGAHVAGNCIIGDDVWIGVNATVSNRILIGNNARVSLGSVVTKDVPESETVTGNFAIPHVRFMQNLKVSIAEASDGR